ncbi:glyoxalase [Vibrio fluvialis]|uniref:glyoxalase n=1 Tax=Vibrio fluvialis TaxID=676 RepID=UPI00192BEA81|nr:glyoxalase [Vibrio fluvialis]MBL4279719.1 glyoxalase [Vibrio fluvialis]MBY8109836.1 glyoxalase [Vibrio fluvialis]MBY8293213.1 glyoxalase [Vibrio fluvialis]MBY8312527.1 glyoxalase [Vibrio fluvialis]
MALVELKAALASAISDHQTLEQNIKSYAQEKQTQESRLRTLIAQVSAKQTELNNALTQESSEALTVELNNLHSQKQACETLIRNITNYMKDKSHSEKTKASYRVQDAQKALLLFVYEDIKTQLDVLTDEQKELLKDFVVIDKMVADSMTSGRRSSYYLGSAFDAIYGELRGEAFTAHQTLMLEKYTA